MAKAAPAAKKLFLVDAMAHVYRAFFAPMPQRLTGPNGAPTNVPFLFGNILKRLIKDYEPRYIGVVFDPPGATFRDKLFEKYKAQRQPMPDDMRVQIPLVRRLCEAMRLPILEERGYEADDVIGTIALQAAKQGFEVLIVSNDKDMMQLVRKNVRTLKTSSGGAKGDILVDDAKVQELLGVSPEQVVDYMALLGDTVDNIPGAKGIGEKGAAELIQKYGTVEKALDHADEVKSKRYREALQQQRDQVLMSKQLARIATDVPLQVDLQSLERREPDVPALAALYRELGFSSLLKELGASAVTSSSAAVSELDENADYAQLESAKEFREYLAKLPPNQPLAVWLNLDLGERESEGFGTRIAAIEVSSRAGEGRSVWTDEKGEVLGVLAPLLEDSERPKIVHDPKIFSVLVAETRNVQHATQLYSYLLRPTTANHNFNDVVMRQFSAILGSGPGERGDYLQRLAPVLYEQVKQEQLEKVYEEIDLPLASVLAAMERDGVLVDHKALDAMSRTMEREITALEKHIWKLAGSEFNINSPQQLAEILFDKMSLTLGGRRRGKARSTAADVLEELALTHELPRKVLEYRELAKLKSTYVDALPKAVHAETGRLHTSFSQTGSATGRLSSSDPNLQNIPVRSELGRQIRAAFVAGPGNALLSADYSQIELRILAHFSKDPVLVEAFRAGQDIHARTAEEVFGVSPLLQNAEHRRTAKAINFGIIYGQTPFGLAAQLDIDQKEAAKFIAAYFARYSGVKEYLERSLAEARKAGATRTLFGRMRPIPEITSPQVNLRNFAERTALNTPLQGTAADLIKLAMIALARQLEEQKFQAKMILQVHDELLFEAPHNELERLRPLVRNAMENVHELTVPLVVDLKAGPNWRDMK